MSRRLSRPLFLTSTVAGFALLGQLGSAAGQETSAPAGTDRSDGAAAVIAPAEYLGFPVGADFKLATWDSVTNYLNQLADASPSLRVDTLGRSTQGRPFVVVTATSSENMLRLDEIRARQAKLADPRRLAEGELESILRTQPAVVLIGHNIHSTEIASSQGSMELAHALITDTELVEALQGVVVLLVPSVNPDGMSMVVDWYRRTVGTPYEGSRMPWLYHAYVGHDNNRDWFMLTQVETQMITDLLYRDWFPEVVYDVHQMGNAGARFFVPPFDDPVNPNLDPLLVRMISLFGLQMSTELEAAGKTGVVNNVIFDLWWHGGNRSVPTRHNMVGILSEAASARIASPIFQEPGELDRQPELGVSYPNPWPGGWWRMRDIIDYQMIAARALIGLAARQRRQLISNYVEVGRRAIEAGTSEPPYAYVIPAEQRDVGSAARMLDIIRRGGVEVQRAEFAFTAGAVEYPAGSWVVLMAQPYRAHVKDLLERQNYPDRRLYSGGPPDRPYDVSGWTLPLQMGVDAVAISLPFEAELRLETGTIRPLPGSVVGEGSTYALENVTNAANLAINKAAADGARVVLLSEPLNTGARVWPVGTAVLQGSGVRALLEDLAASEGLSAQAVAGASTGYDLGELRVGLYQPWTASMDEGWTRWVFETWGLPFLTLHDSEIRAGDLKRRYDVIIFPDASAESIVEGRARGTIPPEYTDGLGMAGVDAIRAFVESGGTLVCLARSSDFAIEHLSVPVNDVRPSHEEQASGKAFFAPGSILSVRIDSDHPLGYGMPREAAIYYANSPILEVPAEKDGVTVVARYPDTGQLLSGYALHTEFLTGKAALIEATHGAGRVILIGFRPQHRGQPHETFKLLFNAVYRGSASGPERVQF